MATDSSQSPSPSSSILNDSQISRFCSDWNETEKWVKKGENIIGNVVLPSINEMRYAGRRLVDAFEAAENGDGETAKRHLFEAQDNLIKARHDVVDSIVHHISDNANKYRESIGATNLQKHFSEYGELFDLLKKIEYKISKSREERKNRNAIYGEIMGNDLSKLNELHNALIEKSLPAVEKIKKDSWSLYYFRVARSILVSLGIVGVIISFFNDLVGFANHVILLKEWLVAQFS